MHTPNLTQDNIARIRELFPGCVVEAKDEGEGMKDENLSASFGLPNSSLRYAIDFDLLRQELSGHIVEGPQERYHLNWPGKREALLTANAPIAKTLRPCREESVDFDTTQNLFIEGDNLDALKLLQETYLGKVKMIYIDPPYNTGNDFIYDDDFAENTKEFLQRSQQKDAKGNRLVANTESNGRFHSDWLSMMYPRLKLARNLLRDDGVIFISIDESEISNIKKILYEIFGEKSILGIFVKPTTGGKNPPFFKVTHEYLICCLKTCLSNESLKARLEISETDSTRSLRKDGDADRREDRPDMFYPIFANVETSTLNLKRNNLSEVEILPLRSDGSFGRWRWSKEKFLNEKNRLVLKDKGDNKYDVHVLTTAGTNRYLPWNSIIDTNIASGGAFLNEAFGFSNVFSYPKNPNFIKWIIDKIKADDECIVLDFFAGSATTAHAVMQLNAEDGGNRQFIMVQLPEVCDEKSEAFKAGYKTIAEISKERIRRAGKKISADYADKRRLENQDESNLCKSAQSADKKLDIGFRVLKTDTSNMADIYYTPDALEKGNLELFVDNIKPDRTPEDLLFQIMLDWGVDLSLPIRKELVSADYADARRLENQKENNLCKSVQSADKHPSRPLEVFFVDENALVACFDAHGGVDESFVKELARHQPLRVVFRDAGFRDSTAKINVEQIFKLISPATEVKCI